MAETGTVVQNDAEPPDAPDEEFTDQTAFLNAIHPAFLALVFPIDCDLVDHLKASHVFDSEDEEIIRAEKSRKSRARQCWSRLTRVPPKQFHAHCIPALKATCAPVVEGKTFRWDGRVEVCLHHLLRRTVPLRRFADMFPGTGGCSHEEYQKIIEGNSHDDDLWDLVFKLCSRNKDNSAVRSLMETTLESIAVPVPADLPSQLASRVPCACVKTERGTKRKGKISKKRKKLKKQHKKFKKEAQKTTDMEKRSVASVVETFPLPKSSSSDDADKQRPTSEACPAAVDEGNNAGGPNAKDVKAKPEEEDDDYCFASEEQKETFLKQLEEINKMITEVSGMKAVFHEVSGIQTELGALRMQTKSKASQETILRYEGKIPTLRAKIRDIKKKLQSSYEEASRIIKEFQPTGSDAHVPSKFETMLQERREVLVSEFAEADGFYKKSCDIFNELNMNQEKSATDSLPVIDKYITIGEICQNTVDEITESGVEIPYNETDDAFEESLFEPYQYEEAISFDEDLEGSDDGEDDTDVDYEEDYFSFTDEETDIDGNDGEDDSDYKYEEDDISYADEEDDIDVDDGEDDIDNKYEEDDISYTDEEVDVDVDDGEDNTGYFGEGDDADFDEEFSASDEEGDWY